MVVLQLLKVVAVILLCGAQMKPNWYCWLVSDIGPSVCCSGRSSLWATCPILAKPIRKCWSLSPVEEEWTHQRTVQGQCKYFLTPSS